MGSPALFVRSGKRPLGTSSGTAGIHGVEPLFTIMGPGCEAVTRVHTKGADVAVGVWKDGRIGTFRGIRNSRRGYGSTVFGSKGIVPGGTLPISKHAW